MPSLNWAAFNALPGSKSQNFENLCRALILLHFGKYGQFAALKNQPGVEFHLMIKENCPILGEPPRWYGWQCKLHTRTTKKNLTSSSKKDIEDSLKKTEKYLPELTDWILWTPYTLSKSDQEWFESLETMLTLHQWTDDEIDTYLNGPGLFLRNTYFGELVITPEDLKQQRQESVQLIKERWLEDVHQPVEAEHIIRRMLGETESWNELINVGQRLKEEAETISDFNCSPSDQLKKTIDSFAKACFAFVDTLLHFHEILSDGDIDVIKQKLAERKTLINKEIFDALRIFRSWNLPISLDATNALDDMLIAQKLLNEVQNFLMVGIVAVLSEAGGGKTQMAAQITAPQENRPAGVLLHGRNLHRGQTLNDLARHFSINGNPLDSIENLLAAIDAAAKRSKCRLPIVIDGLNEAENPKNWKGQLAILTEMLNRYPNVLVVCTLRTGEHRRNDHMTRYDFQTNPRETFAVMSLPDGIEKRECDGFGGYNDEAIQKYFHYYKINPEDAEIPVDFFNHPLNLRIFCEVINPKRESEVRINSFPVTLSPLFEKFVFNACERISQMTNLSYTTVELESSIYKLGIELWNSKKREIDEENYRNLISDTNDLWDFRIVNLLAQEGIIFRNPGAEPDKFMITPVYDALGGYIIAHSLLKKYSRDFSFQWLQNSETIELFIGENSHELAYDIFRSLVTLTPRHMHSRNLWEVAPEKLKNSALVFSTEIESKFLDDDTTAEISKLINDNIKARKYLFSKLKEIRSVSNHPLNSNFLDSILREMPVSERDLSWTEWIREKQSVIYDDLNLLETKWKNNLAIRTETDCLRAKWIMWILTSTNRELRDLATRSLYWFGRGESNTLFEETINSLEINDPYVPERMLAASYGVAMAKHVDLEDETFIRTTLPNYAEKLYESMFAENAHYETTHLLSREYAVKTIELAILHNPTLFSPEEMNRCKPQFTEEGLSEWGESMKKGETLCGVDSPFNMDFLNYTLGALVPHRGNYDFENEEFQKLCAKVLWRVEQLGWSSDLFKDIDDSIERESQRIRIGSDTKKIERYGKKYSWIAYFEISGIVHDQGIIDNWSERTSSVDIDPSFPELVDKDNIIENDFLGDSELKEWVEQDSLTEVDSYLKMEKVQSEQGPWITLDGDFTQKDKKRGRKLFCFIRSFLVDNKEADSFLTYITKQDLAGRWLPEKPSVYYTFAGEIPWCNILPKNEQTEFKFVTSEETIKVQRTKIEFDMDDEISNGIEYEERLKCFNEGDFKQIKIKKVPVEVDEIKREYINFNALVPVVDYSWESYHSTANNSCKATFLAKEITTDLDLIGQPQTFDMFTKDGVRVTYNISDHSDDYNNHQFMFFMRENMLNEYLKKNELTLIWAVWGEREYFSTHTTEKSCGSEYPDTPYKVFSYIKKHELGN
jgi:hypothetical protein